MRQSPRFLALLVGWGILAAPSICRSSDLHAPTSAPATPTMPSGDLDGAVSALLEFRGDLIAAGDFTKIAGAPADHIARWNGSSWEALGGGADGAVADLAVYQDALIATGNFKSIGGVPARWIARWDGTTWSPLGAGLEAPGAQLAVVADSLYASGAYTESTADMAPLLWRWDGNEWSKLPASTGLFLSHKYATGIFAHLNRLLVVWEPPPSFDWDPPIVVWSSEASSWDGTSWTEFPTSQDPGSTLRTQMDPTTFATIGDSLVAGGFLFGLSPSGSWYNWFACVAADLADDWYPLTTFNEQPAELLVHGGRLFGVFYVPATSDGFEIRRFAEGRWTLITPNGDRPGPLTIGSYHGLLVAAGALPIEEGLPASGLAAWDGSRWWTLGAVARSVFHAEAASPDPFMSSIRLSFEVPSAQHIRATVLDVLGRRVCTLLDAPVSVGSHEIEWNGTTAGGRSVPSGVFLIRLESPGMTMTQRVVRVR